MADAPVAQAVQAVALGPLSRYLMVTFAVGIFPRTCNIVILLAVLKPYDSTNLNLKTSLSDNIHKFSSVTVHDSDVDTLKNISLEVTVVSETDSIDNLESFIASETALIV